MTLLSSRGAASTISVFLLLGTSFSSSAQIPCSSFYVGQNIYSTKQCPTASGAAACTRLLVTKVSGGKVYFNQYSNAYYQWYFTGTSTSSCAR
jgi:hypothetical protein